MKHLQNFSAVDTTYQFLLLLLYYCSVLPYSTTVDTGHKGLIPGVNKYDGYGEVERRSYSELPKAEVEQCAGRCPS
eukprot:COSAG02_NODE_2747_length_8108_cov_3.195405_4_plen_76_part_00